MSGHIEHDTRRGSSVLMHDGGGPRGQTLRRTRIGDPRVQAARTTEG